MAGGSTGGGAAAGVPSSHSCAWILDLLEGRSGWSGRPSQTSRAWLRGRASHPESATTKESSGTLRLVLLFIGSRSLLRNSEPMSRSLLSACRQLDTSCAFIMCTTSWRPGGGRSAADGLRRSRPASLQALACRGTSSSSVLAIFMCQRAQAENAPAPAPRCTRARLSADAPTRRRRRLTTAVRDRPHGLHSLLRLLLLDTYV